MTWEGEGAGEGRNQTSGRTYDTDSSVQEHPGPDRPKQMCNRDLKQ
jgi:hypothetical protein